MNMIKVSATSRTAGVAGAIAGIVREQHRAEVQAIGASAVNQAVKALILATGYLRLDGIHISCVPEFTEVTIEERVRTAIKLVIEPGQMPISSQATDVTTDDEGRPSSQPDVQPERALHIAKAP